MADIYHPQELQEDAAMKKLLLDTAVDVQVILQLLVSKGIIFREEVSDMREKVKRQPKYKLAYDLINQMDSAGKMYKDNPEEYLKMIFNSKLKR